MHLIYTIALILWVYISGVFAAYLLLVYLHYRHFKKKYNDNEAFRKSLLRVTELLPDTLLSWGLTIILIVFIL